MALSWKPLLAVFALSCVTGFINYSIRIDLPKADSERPNIVPEILYLSKSCALDLVNGQAASLKIVSISDKTKVKITGWAFNVAAGTTPNDVFIALEGKSTFYIRASRHKRQDVADGFKQPRLINAGWDVHADLSVVDPGSYLVQVIQIEGEKGEVCITEKSIVIN